MGYRTTQVPASPQAPATERAALRASAFPRWPVSGLAVPFETPSQARSAPSGHVTRNEKRWQKCQAPFDRLPLRGQLRLG